MSDESVVTCPNCGAAAPPGATFCPNCGQALAGGAAGYAGVPGTPGAPGAPGGPFRAGPLSPADTRTWAIAAHVSALGTALLGGVSSFIGPLVVWLLRRDSDPFVAEHALEALNFNITVDALVIVAIVLSVLSLGLGFIVFGPLLLVLGVLWLVFTIQAAGAASRGESYRYPLSVRLVS